ncbi:hypothetical protein GCM10009727_19150 [Actinomadura napierensis]|uniref:Aspartate/glutamate/uridylate kinase domain-containing protein n=1 Tax=Actinomadura napierensis TaxID=267854 RepID=A0ABN2YJN5_9ACTN
MGIGFRCLPAAGLTGQLQPHLPGRLGLHGASGHEAAPRGWLRGDRGRRGGVPVDPDHHGVEALVDEDLTAALLATRLKADTLLLLTDVAGVMRDDDTVGARPIREISPERLRARDLPGGSMGPKAKAACRFAGTPSRCRRGHRAPHRRPCAPLREGEHENRGTMSTELQTLDEATCLSLLRSVPVGRVAWCAEDGTASILPVNFVMDGAALVSAPRPAPSSTRYGRAAG